METQREAVKDYDEDGYCTKEIQTRIEMAKKVFTEKEKLFTCKMNLELKKRIMKCSVWSVALCAVETWTLTQTHRRRLEAFEMLIWRTIEKISCLDKVTNNEVLRTDTEKGCQKPAVQQKTTGADKSVSQLVQYVMQTRSRISRT